MNDAERKQMGGSKFSFKFPQHSVPHNVPAPWILSLRALVHHAGLPWSHARSALWSALEAGVEGVLACE